MRFPISALVTAVLVISVVGAPAPAEAAKVIFYQSGDDIFEVGPLPSPFDKVKKLSGAKAGYKCKIFGLFWAYLHIWECRPVAVRGREFFKSPALTKAILAKYPQSEMKVDFWKKHGRWVLALAIVLLAVGGVMGRKKKKKKK